MIQLSPFALRAAARLEELDDSGRRAAYMVIEEIHRLQAELQEEKSPSNYKDTTEKNRNQ